MVGMRDVAREAGVSTSTVSLVVNGNGYVSPAMAERVQAAMDRLNYVPNELARNLSRNRTNLVGVIIPTIRHPFFATLTASLQRALYEQGLRTALCSTADVDQDVSQYVDMLRRRAMDGIIMGAHAVYPADYWSSIDRPIVAFDRFLGGSIPSVGSDHSQGGRLAAELFVRTGARRVVEIGGPRTHYQTAAGLNSEPLGSITIAGQPTFPPIRYHLAFERTLLAKRIRYEYMEIESVARMEEFKDAAHLAFERHPDLDAIVAPDLAAAFCAQEALRRGRSIPGDVQIIAYDGTYVSDLAGVRLTSVLQDFDGLANALVRRLVQVIPGKAYQGAGAADQPGAGEGDQAVSELISMSLKPGESTRWTGSVQELLSR
ncbi:LacI family DNA-binding transcriptional regulator [Bifidobacterium xylocopae]|uniref:LacI family transcriptional regulator n=1 Tax=Bifidobacterium xylocopae TaxID=2493119 RepID=A0A366KD23_9BIFI|nr:LacI family DNA-binding transcriptional regulator [Bifidobacterium xylocopae]RBP99013.1 LacI family transcriptional regulator [Bifidobacterium xylocopae]